jgi:hypothetical protein
MNIKIYCRVQRVRGTGINHAILFVLVIYTVGLYWIMQGIRGVGEGGVEGMDRISEALTETLLVHIPGTTI